MRVNREVKRYLLGRTYMDDGIMEVIDDTGEAIKSWQGSGNGATQSVLFGIASRRNVYNVEGDIDEQFTAFAQKFIYLGRLAAINSVPDAVGCYRRSSLGNPVLYTLEKEISGRNTLTVTCFTARSLVSFFKLIAAMKDFDEQLEAENGNIVHHEITPEEKKLEKLREKEEKKAERQKIKEEARLKHSQSLGGIHKLDRKSAADKAAAKINPEKETPSGPDDTVTGDGKYGIGNVESKPDTERPAENANAVENPAKESNIHFNSAYNEMYSRKQSRRKKIR